MLLTLNHSDGNSKVEILSHFENDFDVSMELDCGREWDSQSQKQKTFDQDTQVQHTVIEKSQNPTQTFIQKPEAWSTANW